MTESLVFTMRLIKKRPLRSLLTILQIALGVWIVATILTMNFQAHGRIDRVLNRFGENLMQIYLQKETQVGDYFLGEIGYFYAEDLARLQQESENVEAIFTLDNIWQVRLKAHGLEYQLRGLTETSADAISALDLNIVEGYGFTRQDEEQKNPVALISTEISKQLFPDESAVGKTIDIESDFRDDYVTFEVIGVYEPLDPLLQLFFQETTMIILKGSRNRSAEFSDDIMPIYGNVFVKSLPGKSAEAIIDAQINLNLDDFTIISEYFCEKASALSSAVNYMTMVLGAFAFVAIIISSLGILSIMLVNVVERTREVGLRKALGASKLSIVIQVLHESLIFSFLGAVIGIVGAVISSRYIIDGLLTDFFFESMSNLGQFHPLSALISAALALALGALFGLYPAVQAARMPVVEALRDA